MTLCSRVKPDLAWKINGYTPDAGDHDFIRSFCPTIYHNDLECYLWAFDTKLPSGKWLENIRFSNDLRQATAFIYSEEV